MGDQPEDLAAPDGIRFVVVGKAPGTTKVHVNTADGGRTINVTIAPPPATAPQTTVAR